MRWLERITHLAVAVPLAGAVLQWAVVAGRLRAAVWGWYKFYGYGGGGELPVSAPAQVEFFVASTGLLLVSCVIAQHARRTSRITVRIARGAAIALFIGAVVWGSVLLSPLVRWS